MSALALTAKTGSRLLRGSHRNTWHRGKTRFPNQLSGGEQQRVAIARSLISRPAIILADEPTGNLDRRNTQEIVSLFKLVNKSFKSTIILITHNEKVALACEKVYTMVDGRLYGEDGR